GCGEYGMLTLLVSVGHIALPGKSFNIYQEDTALPAPFFTIPNGFLQTAIVCPPSRVPVVHAATVAGGGQKPTGSIIGSPKAVPERTRNNMQTTNESPNIFEALMP